MKKDRSNLFLNLIIIQKAFWGFLTTVLSAGILSMINQDLEAFARRLAFILNVKADDRFMILVMEKITQTNTSMLMGFSAIGFFYSGLNITEAYGLYRRYRWAEYLTVIATSFFIPFEIYEVVKQPDIFRWAVLIINILVVIFLAKHKELFPRRMVQNPPSSK